MKIYSILFALLLVGCSQKIERTAQAPVQPIDSVEHSTYTWTKLLDSAAWRKNYNFQLVSHNDSLYVLHPDGTWVSKDGSTWTKSSLQNTIHNHAFLDYVYFNRALLGLGHFKGNIEAFTFQPSIFSSENFTSWKTVSTTSNLPNRFFYHPFVFKNKIWIIGGEDKQKVYADIWNSEDGIRWTKQKDNSNIGPRSGSQIVCKNDSLFLFNNDVWTSTDGLNWTKIKDEIVRGEEIFGYTAVVYDNQIWLLGCNRNGEFSSEVLHSKDGKNWQQQRAPWLPRGGIAATVHQNKIFITGGKYGGTTNHPDFRYDNDVWVMEKK